MLTPHNGSGSGRDGGGYPPYDGNGSGGSLGNDGRALARRPQSFTPARRQMGGELAGLPLSLLEGNEKRRFNFSDYIGLLWRGKWVILACTIVAGLIAAYFTYSLPYIYRSQLQVIINERDANMMPLFQGQSSVFWQPPERILKKELQILSSQPLLQQTAVQLVAQRYMDTTTRDSVIPVVAAAERKVASMKIGPEKRHEQLITYVASSVRGLVSFKPSKDADIIQIITQAGDPGEAALITNIYAQVYERDNQAQNRSKAKSLKDFLAEKLETIRDSLAKQEQLVRNYREGKQVVELGDQTRELLAQDSKLDQEAVSTRIEISALTQRLEGMRQQMRDRSSTLPTAVASAMPEYITKMSDEIGRLEVERKMIEAGNPMRASEVWYQNKLKEMDDRIASLRSELREKTAAYMASPAGSSSTSTDNTGRAGIGELGGLRQKIFEDEISLRTLKARMSAIDNNRGQIASKKSQVPGLELDMERLERDKAATEKVYMQINEEYNRQMIAEQSVFSNVRIIEFAQPDPVPVSPDRTGDVITGSLAGLGIGIGIVLLLAFLDTTIHTPEELEKHGFTMLTAIPAIREELFTDVVREDITPSGKVSPHLITQVDPKSPIAEAYRSLRTGVQFASLEDQSRVILFTSSTPQEGKSTTSVNTAIVFAQSGSKTLLVDCDLRRPILHSVFGVPKDPGLVNCLVGNIPLDEAIYTTKIPNLDLLTSGSIPPNPSELLGSRPMRDLLESLRGRYDTIIVDSPPTAAVTDAVILATLADISIVVVRAHKTKIEFLQKTRDALERVFVSPLGVVLNDFDVSQSYGSSYKYYRYYKYYGYYGNSAKNAASPGTPKRSAIRNLLDR
ncbi:MAG TPA: polysaccharide biosynthesis tyrosine autokinase [Candidatus Kapabacteria bacterium]|nr:polysaccharide biosynthesis tyrosine autokinase [Candidatus Kapabacteria bacterium]